MKSKIPSTIRAQGRSRVLLLAIFGFLVPGWAAFLLDPSPLFGEEKPSDGSVAVEDGSEEPNEKENGDERGDGGGRPKPPVRQIEPGKGARSRGYLSLADALETVREDYRPVLIYYDGGKAPHARESSIRLSWEKYFDGANFRRHLRRIPVVRLSDRDLLARYPGGLPIFDRLARRMARARDDRSAAESSEGGRARESDEIGEVLGLSSGYPSLVLLDFRERIVRRYAESLPTKLAFKKRLTRFLATNREFAKRARLVEKALEQSRYARNLKKWRVAVQAILPYLDGKVRRTIDPVAQHELTKLEREYREVVRDVLSQVDVLEQRRRYNEAMEILEDLINDYPFPDVVRESNHRSAEIYRKAKSGV